LRRSYRTRSEAVERFRFLPESSRADESLRRHIAEHSVGPELDGRFGYKFDPGWFGLPSRPRPDLARIRCPALLIRGGESALLTAEAALEFSSQLPSCRFIEIAEAGHHILIDQPEALLSSLENFIDEHPQNP
jgi:pimeloyl-ACP methyl ester carboxylesterase